MTRAGIIALSLVCCGPAEWRTEAYVVNVVLAVGCYLAAGRDLTQRGWSLGWLFAGSYLLPLVGLVVYVGLSNRPVVSPAT